MRMQAKINVLVVTYKHQEVIGRTIDSILSQKKYGLNKIIICDDCSPDNNWDVISSYVKRFPDYITAYRNEKNLGIYGNSDKLISLKGDADLFCWLEGDDALCEGFFENIQKVISTHNVDLKGRVGICCDWKMILPSGEEKTFSNRASVLTRMTPLSLYLRGMITWRGSVFSAAVLDSFQPTKLDAGLNLAETLFDSQFFKYVDRLYYSNYVGTIYYAQVGISTTLGSKSSYMNEENILKIQYILDNFDLNNRDKHWYRYKLYKTMNQLSPSLSNVSHALINYVKGVYRGKGSVKRKLRKYVFPLIKSLFKK